MMNRLNYPAHVSSTASSVNNYGIYLASSELQVVDDMWTPDDLY